MKRANISSRIYFIISIFVCILIIVHFLSSYHALNAMQQQRESNTYYAIKQLNNSLNSKISLLKKFSSLINQDTLKDIILSSEKNSKASMISLYTPIEALNNYTDELLYFAVFTPENEYKISSNMTNTEYALLKEAFQQHFNSDDYGINNSFSFFALKDNPYNEMIICCFNPIYTYQFNPSSKPQIGTLAVCCKINVNKLLLTENTFRNMQILLYNNTSDSSFNLIDCSSFNKHKTIENTITLPLSSTGWIVNAILYPSPSEYNIGIILNLIIADAIIIFVMFIILYIEFKRAIKSPLLKMTSYISNYTLASHNSPLKLNSNNEFEIIANEINKMLVKNKETTHQIFQMQQKLYEIEFEKLRLEMQSLQHQINPHFLYNTLDCIKNIAVVKHVSEIEEATLSLSRILRYSTNSNLFASLEQELSMLKTYLSIINIRMPNTYKVSFHIPEEFLTICIPKMILQPIFENIFKHAHSGKQIQITLATTMIEKETLCITIKDDGRGISHEKLEEIKHLLSNNDSIPTTHIGLYNVNRRIKLYCGEQYGLTIDSKAECYTSINLFVSLHPLHSS